ncbi:MAG: hypothetical protein AB7I50_20280, partial [Vicinamibacterales bacterium]
IGIAAAHMASEDDWVRVRAGMISYNVFAGLELLALARYGNTLSSGPSAWVYVLFLFSVLLVGGLGMRASQEAVVQADARLRRAARP